MAQGTIAGHTIGPFLGVTGELIGPAKRRSADFRASAIVRREHSDEHSALCAAGVRARARLGVRARAATLRGAGHRSTRGEQGGQYRTA